MNLFRAFPGKVDTGFPIGNATNIESRALSGHDPCNFQVNLIGKRSSDSEIAKLHGLRKTHRRTHPLISVAMQPGQGQALDQISINTSAALRAVLTEFPKWVESLKDRLANPKDEDGAGREAGTISISESYVAPFGPPDPKKKGETAS